MKKQLLTLSLILSTLTVFAENNTMKKAQVHELWTAPTAWIRDYLVSVSGNLPSAETARNQVGTAYEKLGKVFEPYYGNEISQEFTEILTQQAKLTLSFIDSIKKNDEKGAENHLTALKKSDILLSSFLNKTNPYIGFIKIKEHLSTYRNALTKMIQSRLQNKWQDDSKAYEEVREQNEQTAQIISQALEHAFPEPKGETKRIQINNCTVVPPTSFIKLS